MSTSLKILLLTVLLCNAALSVVTMLAAGTTGSSVMLALAIQAVAIVSCQLLLTMPDTSRETLQGQTSAEAAFWSYGAAMLPLAIGCGMAIYEGIDRLTTPRPLVAIEFAYTVIVFSLAIQLMTLWGVGHVARTLDAGYSTRALPPAAVSLKVQSRAGLAGLVLGALGVYGSAIAGAAWADGLAAMLIGCVLAGAAAVLALHLRASFRLGVKP